MDQDSKSKPNLIDKIIGTFCYFAIAINLNMAWSKGYKGMVTETMMFQGNLTKALLRAMQ